MPRDHAPSGNVCVEAYGGFKGEETPRAFVYAGVRLEVREILRRWYTEDHAYFTVLAEDGWQYVLRFDVEQLVWELVMRQEHSSS